MSTFAWSASIQESSEKVLDKYSQTVTEETYIHGLNFGAGFSVGQPVFSIDYEYRLSNHFGIGAYGAYSSRKGQTQPGLGSLGVDFKTHFALHSVDIYLRPGFGATYFDTSNTKVVFFSPIFAAGALVRVAQNVAVGVEHLQIFNWSSSDQPAKAEALLASLQWRF